MPGQPVIRSGIDDPIGLPVAASLVQRGMDGWRSAIVLLLGALLTALIGGPTFYAYLFIYALLLAVVVGHAVHRIRGRALARAVRDHNERHSDASVHLVPLMAAREWVYAAAVVLLAAALGTVVAAQVGVLPA